MSGVEHGSCPPGLHSVHECNTWREESPAEQGQQPAVEAVEALEGPEPSPDTPETAEERSEGQEARDRALLARHLRVLASAVNIADWPAYIRKVAAGHESGTSWYEPVQEAPEEPVAEPPVTARRPHWMPEKVWLGIKVGEWPIQCFSNQEQAEHWAAGAKWEPDRQAYEHRRIWPVDIPDGTQPFTVEKIPASTRLVEVQW